MPFIDFAALKQRVLIEEAAQFLGLKLVQSGRQLRAACPCNGNDRSLVITPSKGLFYCFPSDKGGDVIALTAHVRECSVKEAAEFLVERYQLGAGTSTSNGTVSKARATAPQDQEEPGDNPAPGLKPLEYLDAEHPAVEAAGFDSQEAKALGIGYAPKGVLRGSVAVPIRNDRGVLLSYIGVTEVRLPPKGLLGTNVVKFPKSA